MNYRAHKWKWLIGLGLFAALATQGVWWYFDDQGKPDALAELLKPISRENANSARTLMSQVPDQLATYQSLQSRIRQRVNIMGCEMTGSGFYFQGDPLRHQTKIEFRLQFEEAVLSWRQICDGEALWTFNKGLDGSPKIARVRLDQVEDAPADDLTSFRWGAGGLPQFMANLAGAFDFTRVERGQLDDMRTQVVFGRWRPERLEKLLGDSVAAGAVNPDELPVHLPKAVVITLGSDDKFPYRIEFLSTDEEGELYATVVMELFEVDYRAELTDAEFEFDPGDVEIRDGTKDYLEALKWTVGD